MSAIGNIFKVTTYGESHGKSVGAVIEGFPSNFKVDFEEIQAQLNRRKPNQSKLLSQRNEPDILEVESGFQGNLTLGTPIMFKVNNKDMKPKDYSYLQETPRPGHADYTYFAKYGINARSGGGRASARETISRVAAGALAQQYLSAKFGCQSVAFVSQVGPVKMDKQTRMELIESSDLSQAFIDAQSTFEIFSSSSEDLLDHSSSEPLIFYRECDNSLFDIEGNQIKEFTKEEVILVNDTKFSFKEKVNIRCPVPAVCIPMIIAILQAKREEDSLGGVITGVVLNPPQSLGEPCFDKLEAELAKSMLSIPSTKGFDIGSGFEGTELRLFFDLEVRNTMTLSRKNAQFPLEFRQVSLKYQLELTTKAGF